MPTFAWSFWHSCDKSQTSLADLHPCRTRASCPYACCTLSFRRAGENCHFFAPEGGLYDHKGKIFLSLCCSGCVNKKLGYPQRKCVSNVAILYGPDGISVLNRYYGSQVWQTDSVRRFSGAIYRINTKRKFETRSKGSVAVDSCQPVFNTLVRVEPLNTGQQNLAKRN